MENYTVVNNNNTGDLDVVIVVNDWYDKSDSCGYVIPLDESDRLDYTIVKEEAEDASNKYHEVNYAV